MKTFTLNGFTSFLSKVSFYASKRRRFRYILKWVVSYETWESLLVPHWYTVEGILPTVFLYINCYWPSSEQFLIKHFLNNSLFFMLGTIVLFMGKSSKKLTLITNIFSDNSVKNLFISKITRNSVVNTPMDFRGRSKDF